jgi:hypothetical protein
MSIPRAKLPPLLLYEDGKPVIPELKNPVRLKDQALLESWQDNAFRLQQRLQQSIEEDDATKTKAYAIANGIATEKVLLLAGRPTQLSAHIHEIRPTLPEVAARLAKLAARVVSESPNVRALPAVIQG